MNHIQVTVAVFSIISSVVISGCSSESGVGGDRDGDIPSANGSEHARDTGERGSETGEESGTQLALNERYDSIRNGVRLTMVYNEQENSFIGTVENTTGETLRDVQVEVHLSNGLELGPTTPADLGPGVQRQVTLRATDKTFDKWTPHPEVGTGDNSSAGGEAGEDQSGEHDG